MRDEDEMMRMRTSDNNDNNDDNDDNKMGAKRTCDEDTTIKKKTRMMRDDNGEGRG